MFSLSGYIVKKTRAAVLPENNVTCLSAWLVIGWKPEVTADGLLVCIKDKIWTNFGSRNIINVTSLSKNYLNSAVFMVFLVDYKSCSKLIDYTNFNKYQPYILC